MRVTGADDDFIARLGENTGKAFGHVAGSKNCNGHGALLLPAAFGQLR
jgi:hypothetical protein